MASLFNYHVIGLTYLTERIGGVWIGWLRKSIFLNFANYKISTKINLIFAKFVIFKNMAKFCKISRTFVEFSFLNFREIVNALNLPFLNLNR
jgi:hypothetical protein